MTQALQTLTASWIEAMRKIDHLTTVDEHTYLDDEVLPLIEDINFGDLAYLLESLSTALQGVRVVPGFKSEGDRYAAINALRVAADRYDADAKMMREQPGDIYRRIAETFDQQSADVRRIADEIEG